MESSSGWILVGTVAVVAGAAVYIQKNQNHSLHDEPKPSRKPRELQLQHSLSKIPRVDSVEEEEEEEEGNKNKSTTTKDEAVAFREMGSPLVLKNAGVEDDEEEVVFVNHEKDVEVVEELHHSTTSQSSYIQQAWSLSKHDDDTGHEQANDHGDDDDEEEVVFMDDSQTGYGGSETIVREVPPPMLVQEKQPPTPAPPVVTAAVVSTPPPVVEEIKPTEPAKEEPVKQEEAPPVPEEKSVPPKEPAQPPPPPKEEQPTKKKKEKKSKQQPTKQEPSKAVVSGPTQTAETPKFAILYDASSAPPLAVAAATKTTKSPTPVLSNNPLRATPEDLPPDELLVGILLQRSDNPPVAAWPLSALPTNNNNQSSPPLVTTLAEDKENVAPPTPPAPKVVETAPKTTKKAKASKATPTPTAAPTPPAAAPMPVLYESSTCVVQTKAFALLHNPNEPVDKAPVTAPATTTPAIPASLATFPAASESGVTGFGVWAASQQLWKETIQDNEAAAVEKVPAIASTTTTTQARDLPVAAPTAPPPQPKAQQTTKAPTAPPTAAPKVAAAAPTTVETATKAPKATPPPQQPTTTVTPVARAPPAVIPPTLVSDVVIPSLSTLHEVVQYPSAALCATLPRCTVLQDASTKAVSVPATTTTTTTSSKLAFGSDLLQATQISPALESGFGLWAALQGDGTVTKPKVTATTTTTTATTTTTTSRELNVAPPVVPVTKEAPSKKETIQPPATKSVAPAAASSLKAATLTVATNTFVVLHDGSTKHVSVPPRQIALSQRDAVGNDPLAVSTVDFPSDESFTGFLVWGTSVTRPPVNSNKTRELVVSETPVAPSPDKKAKSEKKTAPPAPTPKEEEPPAAVSPSMPTEFPSSTCVVKPGRFALLHNPSDGTPGTVVRAEPPASSSSFGVNPLATSVPPPDATGMMSFGLWAASNEIWKKCVDDDGQEVFATAKTIEPEKTSEPPKPVPPTSSSSKDSQSKKQAKQKDTPAKEQSREIEVQVTATNVSQSSIAPSIISIPKLEVPDATPATRTEKTGSFSILHDPSTKYVPVPQKSVPSATKTPIFGSDPLKLKEKGFVAGPGGESSMGVALWGSNAQFGGETAAVAPTVVVVAPPADPVFVGDIMDLDFVDEGPPSKPTVPPKVAVPPPRMTYKTSTRTMATDRFGILHGPSNDFVTSSRRTTPTTSTVSKIIGNDPFSTKTGRLPVDELLTRFLVRGAPVQ